MKRKKILFVGALSGGGKERRMCELIRYLHELDQFELYLLTSKTADADYPYVMECINGYYEITDSNPTRHHIKSYIKEIKPDIVHSWHTYLTYQIALMRVMLPKFYFIAGFIADGNKDIGIKEKIRTWFTCFVSDVVVSNSWAGIYSHKAPVSKSVVIYNGFNPKRIPTDSSVSVIRNDLHLGDNRVVIMAARMDKMKDFNTFIDAIKILNKKLKDVTYLFCGKGEKEDAYRKRVQNEAIENILFLGFRKDIEVLYKMSSISVLCSAKIHNEGVSNSIMESMAMGVPVVATRSGGTSEIIEDGINGFIIEPEDAYALANRLERLLCSENLRNGFSIAAKKTIENKFSIQKMVGDYINLYSRLKENL